LYQVAAWPEFTHPPGVQSLGEQVRENASETARKVLCRKAISSVGGGFASAYPQLLLNPIWEALPVIRSESPEA